MKSKRERERARERDREREREREREGERERERERGRERVKREVSREKSVTREVCAFPVIDAQLPAPMSNRKGRTAHKPHGMQRPVPTAPNAVISVPVDKRRRKTSRYTNQALCANPNGQRRRLSLVLSP